MYYSTWISLIFIEIFKITANLKRKMGFWRNYSQLFGSTLGTFWTSFENLENRTQIDKNPCTIVHGFHSFSLIFKITSETKHGLLTKLLTTFREIFFEKSRTQIANLKRNDGLLTKLLTTFREYLRNVLDKFHKFGKSHPNWQKPMYYSTWISLIFIEIFKITANLKRNMGFWRNYSQLFGST